MALSSEDVGTIVLYTNKVGALVVFCSYLSNVFTSNETPRALLKLWLASALQLLLANGND